MGHPLNPFRKGDFVRLSRTRLPHRWSWRKHLDRVGVVAARPMTSHFVAVRWGGRKTVEHIGVVSLEAVKQGQERRRRPGTGKKDPESA
jgi:hypothetical protein